VTENLKCRFSRLKIKRLKPRASFNAFNRCIDASMHRCIDRRAISDARDSRVMEGPIFDDSGNISGSTRVDYSSQLLPLALIRFRRARDLSRNLCAFPFPFRVICLRLRLVQTCFLKTRRRNRKPPRRSYQRQQRCSDASFSR